MAPRLRARSRTYVGHKFNAPPPPQLFLTEKEVTILRGAADGLSYDQIGKEVGFKEQTIKKYFSSIFDKLGADNRPHAVAMAMRRGIIE